MRDVNEDGEYRQLKERVKSKEIGAVIWGGIGGIGLVVAFALASAAISTGTAPFLGIAAIAASGLVGAVASYVGFRKGQDVRFDTEELQARREATNLARAMGYARSAEEEMAVAHTMGHRRDGAHRRILEEQRRAKSDSWVDTVTSAANETGLHR
jgi:hypothetical protein